MLLLEVTDTARLTQRLVHKEYSLLSSRAVSTVYSAFKQLEVFG